MKSCSCKVDKPELKAKLPSTQSFRAADRSLLGTRDKYCGRHHSKILNDIISIYHVSIQNIFYFLYIFFSLIICLLPNIMSTLLLLKFGFKYLLEE